MLGVQVCISRPKLDCVLNLVSVRSGRTGIVGFDTRSTSNLSIASTPDNCGCRLRFYTSSFCILGQVVWYFCVELGTHKCTMHRHDLLSSLKCLLSGGELAPAAVDSGEIMALVTTLRMAAIAVSLLDTFYFSFFFIA